VAVCEKLLPGFGELMRATSLKHVPTAILSRQTAGIRGRTLIVTSPAARRRSGKTSSRFFPRSLLRRPHRRSAPRDDEAR